MEKIMEKIKMENKNWKNEKRKVTMKSEKQKLKTKYEKQNKEK